MLSKNYIFDFENAIADTSACYKKTFSEAFSHFKIPFDETKIEEYINTPLDRTFEKYYRGCTCRFRDFVTLFVGCFDSSFDLCRLRPGSAETIRTLFNEGHKIYVFSRTYRFYVERFLERHGIICMITEIRSSEMTENPKDTLRKINSDRNSKEKETVMVGTQSSLNYPER